MRLSDAAELQIILVRHGRPDFRDGVPIAPRELRWWIERYNRAGVVDGPPDAVVRSAAAAIVVSSPTVRAVESASRLAQGRAVTTSELFREADLPHAQWQWPKLPPAWWVVLFRLAWYCGFGGQAETASAATMRAREAAEKLIALAEGGVAVLLVGHGIMNSMIAKQLLARGARGPRLTRSQYWGCSVYRL
jgi:broad specificity phosphatase PhoE